MKFFKPSPSERRKVTVVVGTTGHMPQADESVITFLKFYGDVL